MILTIRPPSTIRGLRDTFNPNGDYTATSTILDMQADSSVANRVNAIVSQGNVGRYNNYYIYEEPSTGFLFSDIGLSYPKLQRIVPSNTPSLAPPSIGAPTPTGASPCPCDSCREEVITETYYASREQTSPDDIPVSMSRDVVICEPQDQGQPTLACADELARVKAAAGINGLRDTVYTMAKGKKRCMDKCYTAGGGENNVNKCLDGCLRISSQPLSRNSLSPSYNQMNTSLSGTANSAWGDCTAKCNSARLSQGDLQRCYAACPTVGRVGRAAVNSRYSVAPSGQSTYQPPTRNLSGISNNLSNESYDDDADIYTATDQEAQLYLPAPLPCEKGNSNTLWFIIVGGACTILGYIIAQALKRR